MDTLRIIQTLLDKYRQAPSFPFDDWTTNAVSFYALMNLWDDVFRLAAGKRVTYFMATLEITMDPESPIYDVTSKHFGQRVRVVPEQDGGTFHFLSQNDTESPAFKSQLGIATDIDPARLAASFEIMRVYLLQPAQSASELKLVELACIERYHSVFGFADYDPFESRLDLGPT